MTWLPIENEIVYTKAIKRMKYKLIYIAIIPAHL